MSGKKWKQTEIIDEKDINELAPFAKFMKKNVGYYFWDKKASKEVCKWEIFITFNKKELEDVYNGKQNRYERRKRNGINKFSGTICE